MSTDAQLRFQHLAGGSGGRNDHPSGHKRIEATIAVVENQGMSRKCTPPGLNNDVHAIPWQAVNLRRLKCSTAFRIGKLKRDTGQGCRW